MSDAYHYCRPYKVSLLTSPNSWVSGLYLLTERGANILQAMRWLLGTFEAGLFPGVAYYLSWQA